MKVIIHNLNGKRCIDYLQHQMGDWLYFSRRIIRGEFIENGKFYCIAPIEQSVESLHEFSYDKGGSGMWQPYPEDVVANFAYDFLQLNKNNSYLIAEDGMRDVGSKFLSDRERKYYTVDNIVIYINKFPINKTEVKDIFKAVRGYGSFPFLIDKELENLKLYEPIDENTKETILGNTCMFFTTIYDDTSYLFWIKNGYEHLLEKMEDYLRTAR